MDENTVSMVAILTDLPGRRQADRATLRAGDRSGGAQRRMGGLQ